MKHLFMLFALAGATFAVGAKTIINRTGIPEFNHRSALNDTRLDVKGNDIVFTRLPKSNIDIYVMDAAGNVELSGALTRKHNAFNVAALHGGRHTVALKQGNKVKVFGYYSGIVITGEKR